MRFMQNCQNIFLGGHTWTLLIYVKVKVSRIPWRRFVACRILLLKTSWCAVHFPEPWLSHWWTLLKSYRLDDGLMKRSTGTQQAATKNAKEIFMTAVVERTMPTARSPMHFRILASTFACIKAAFFDVLLTKTRPQKQNNEDMDKKRLHDFTHHVQ